MWTLPPLSCYIYLLAICRVWSDLRDDRECKRSCPNDVINHILLICLK